jgi:hypothetical protein
MKGRRTSYDNDGREGFVDDDIYRSADEKAPEFPSVYSDEDDDDDDDDE